MLTTINKSVVHLTLEQYLRNRHGNNLLIFFKYIQYKASDQFLHKTLNLKLNSIITRNFNLGLFGNIRYRLAMCLFNLI